MKTKYSKKIIPKTAPTASSIQEQNQKRLITGILLVIVLLTAFYVRFNTLWLPHWQGDQSQYLALAMKLDQTSYDWSRFNLREVRAKARDQVIEGEKHQVLRLTLDSGKLGNILNVYHRMGFGYYDMPLFYKAPLLPIVLQWSHHLLVGPKEPMVVVKSNLNKSVNHTKPAELFRTQIWASSIPLIFSLMTICLIFLATKKWFNLEAAVYASWMMAIHPVSIMTSSKVISEDMHAFWLTLSGVLYFRFFYRKQLWGCFFSGLVMGLAILTNQKSLLFVGVIGLHALLHFFQQGSRQDKVNVVIMSGAFFVGGLLVSGWWFHLVWQTYGNPFWEPVRDLSTHSKTATWLAAIRNRPHPLILFTVGMIFLCPLALFSYLSIASLFKKMKFFFNQDATKDRIVFWLWIWFGVLFAYYCYKTAGGGEQRYMMPVYPAMAILAGYTLERCRVWLSETLNLKRQWMYGAMTVLLIASAFWSVPMGQELVYAERSLFLHKPF